MKKSKTHYDVILRRDVANLGRLGDRVQVKPGYARNFLIPQGMATVATEGNLKQFELERKKLEAKMDALRAEFKEIAEKITAEPLVIEVRVGESDKLYGSVTPVNIGDALEEKGIEVDRRKIILEAPIRSLGKYEVPIRLHPDVIADLVLYVVRQGQTPEDLEADMKAEREEKREQEQLAEELAAEEEAAPAAEAEAETEAEAEAQAAPEAEPEAAPEEAPADESEEEPTQ